MVALLLTTTISCSSAIAIIHRATKVVGLTPQQRIEIIQTIKEHIPTCPFAVVPDERPKPSS
jgi:hypothetical protein